MQTVPGRIETLAIAIPQQPHLIGVRLDDQWYIWYGVGGSFPDSFNVLSDAGAMTIGV